MFCTFIDYFQNFKIFGKRIRKYYLGPIEEANVQESFHKTAELTETQVVSQLQFVCRCKFDCLLYRPKTMEWECPKWGVFLKDLLFKGYVVATTKLFFI